MRLATEPDEARTDRAEAGRRKGDDWKLQAPRWVLLALLMGTSGYIGVQATQNRYLEGALQDGPSKFQQRQGERLASLEAEMNGLTRAVERLAAAHEAQNQTLAKLATQVELSTKRR